MKKLLLTGALSIGSFFMADAQVLMTENFDSYNNGNVTTTIDGLVPGQGSYLLQSSNGAAPTTSTNAAASQAQIITPVFGTDKKLQLTGPNGNKGGSFLFKDGLATAWASRTLGNNIIEVEFDINPGAASTSRNTIGVWIYDATFEKVLVGVTVRAATLEMQLTAYSLPTGETEPDNFTYNLAAAPGIQIPANTVSRIGIAFNKTTGQVRIKGPGIAAAGLTLTGAAVGTDPAEVDFVTFSGHAATTPNTVAATMVMDNVTAKASATDTLLGTADNALASVFAVFPNPASNSISVAGAEALVNGIEIVDLNGRTVKTVKLTGVSEAEINISDLSAGVYMMNISSDKGMTTKKIVKQ